MLRKSIAIRGLACVATLIALSNHPSLINLDDLAEPLKSALELRYAQAVKALNEDDAQAGSYAWGELGMQLQAHNLYEQAIVAYSKAVEQIPDPRWYYLRGIAHGELGYNEASVEDFFQVTNTLQDVAVIWYRFGHALFRFGDLIRAEQALENAVRLDEELAIAHVVLADVRTARNNPVGAKTALERAYAIAPESGQIAYRLSQVERALGNLEKSEAWLAKRENQLAPALDDPMLSMVAQFSTNPTFFVSAARRAWERGDIETSLLAYRHALELEPSNVANQLGFLRLLIAAERFDEANQAVAEIENIALANSEYWQLRATLLLREQRLREALQAIEKSLALNDNLDVRELRRRVEALLRGEDP